MFISAPECIWIYLTQEEFERWSATDESDTKSISSNPEQKLKVMEKYSPRKR